MKRAVGCRIGITLGLAGVGMLVGCSSSRPSMLSGETYVIRTADGGFVVGDSLGMTMKASHDVAFAMAMRESYPDFQGQSTTLTPGQPTAALADFPVSD
ncbi:MAG: hypothetical protein KDA21_09340 [Phycisphaerales bacterium]|nr:hypothetical protein [Phycisphaerales bacterium]